MEKYEQLQLFDLDDYTIPQPDELLFFQPRPKVVYEQLELDLGLDPEPPNDDWSSDSPEAA
ncbi:MAG: hypothetical protein HC799_16700 [Limnothrix sp. RL_2_0]|nr:hypothetical protein [Limnothrix sp. RL_2_0]